MSIVVRRHIPDFIEHDRCPDVSVDNTKALLALPWVKSWSDDPRFHQFSLSDGRYLMAELDGGDEFWVVAIHIGGDAITGLPEWKETDVARATREAWNRGDYAKR